MTGSRRLSRSTLWIFLITLVSRLSGFFRQSALAAAFGSSMQTDAWVMASGLPGLLFSAVYQGVSVTTVPTMADARLHDSREDVQHFVNQVFTLLVGAAFVMVIMGEIFSPLIIRVLAPGFHGPERALTIALSRIMVPSIVFWIASGLLIGILQSGENFFGMTLGPLIVNLVQIFGIVVLGHFFGIRGVAWGFTLSIAAQLLLLVPLVRRRGIRLAWARRFDHPRLAPMMRLMVPNLLISSAGSVEFIVDRILASSMMTGSISSMSFVMTVAQAPLGLIVGPVVTPILTRLALHHSSGNREQFSRLAMRGMHWVLILSLPLMLLLFILNVPVLRMLYEHGQLGAASLTVMTRLLLFAVLALPANAVATYLQQVSFATRNTRRPARFNFIAISVNILGNLVLTRFMGVDGLILATTAANWTNVGLLLWSFNFKRHAVRQLRFAGALAAAGTVMTLVLIGFHWKTHLDRVVGLSLPLDLAQASAAALLAYGMALLWFRVPEAQQLRRYALRVVRRVALGLS